MIVELIEKLNAESKKLKLPSVFTIGNTTKFDQSGLYLTPIRISPDAVSAGCVVFSVEEAISVSDQVDGKVDFVFVDSEKKIHPKNYGEEDVGNVERAVRESIQQSQVLSYKGNDLVVEAVDSLICHQFAQDPRGPSGKKVGIIGAGNVGSKIALKLVERGVDVYLYRRDHSKLSQIVAALNLIKPLETRANIHSCENLVQASKQMDVLIGATAGQPAINLEAVCQLNTNAIVIDVGKGCLSQEAVKYLSIESIPIFRADIRIAMGAKIGMELETSQFLETSMGRGLFKGFPIVSAGLLAQKGEIVVDSFTSPKVIYGLGDGGGDFIRNLSQSEQEILSELEKIING